MRLNYDGNLVFLRFAGNMMTLLYNFGLTAGSLVAYLLESMLNPVEEHQCDISPLHIKPTYGSQNITTLTTVASTTVLTTIITSIASTVSNITVNSTLGTNR